MDLTPFEGKTVLITGASGLIGRGLVKSLVSHSGKNAINVFALVRNEEKARKIFSGLPQENLRYTVTDVCELKAENIGVDYVIHAASKTASKDFVKSPAEVLLSSVKGTEKVLDFARVNNVKGLVYLSSMEVYGAPSTDEKITENRSTDINTMKARSSYPEGKRACECLCAAYAAEYGVPAKVVRLTQTFGEGVDYNDGRLFAELARCVIEGRNIVLKTKGETKRNYIDVDDAVEAIFSVLLYGASGEAYNAANEDTYCSVYDMACSVARTFGNGKTEVVIAEEDISKFGYAPTLKMNLSARKLKNLGWTARVGLMQSFEKMIEYMKTLR